MQDRRAILFLVGLGLWGLLLPGCGDDYSPVTGRVTIAGAPAKDVMVTFYPVDQSLQSASGRVNDGGTYELFGGNEGRRGVQPGQYKVVLAQMATTDASAYQKPAGESGVPGVPDPTFPQEYLTPDTTPKTVEVKSGQNQIDIEIP